MKRPVHPDQTSLFDWQPPQIAVGYSDDVAGRGPLGNRIARLVSRSLRDARDDHGLSRAVIAERIAAETGRKVSEDLLNKWASEASDGHHIPFDAFIGLVRATGDMNLLGFIPAMFGFVVVPEEYGEIIELHEIEAQEARWAERKALLKAKRRR